MRADLTTAREAYERRGWTQARELFGRADEAARPAPEDVERLAVAADMLGGGAIYAASPLLRRLRDIDALTEHFLARRDTLLTAGAVLAGQDTSR